MDVPLTTIPIGVVNWGQSANNNLTKIQEAFSSALSNIKVSAGAASNNLSAITFDNGNGVTFGLNASTLTASVKTDYLTTAMASNRGSDFVQATAAFAGTNASGTIASNGISVSVGAGGAISLQDSATTLSVSKLVFSNANSLSFGLNTAAGVATLTGSVDAQGAKTVSFYQNVEALNGTQSISMYGSTSVAFPFVLPNYISLSYIRFAVSMTPNSGSVATSANTTITAGISSTINLVLYSLGTGGASSSLLTVFSTSIPWNWQWYVQAAGTGSRYTQSYLVTRAAIGATTADTYNAFMSATRFEYSTVSLQDFASNRWIDIPANTLLSPGQYWLTIGSTSTSSQQVAGMTGLRFSAAHFYAVSQVNMSVRSFGANFAYGIPEGVGSFTTAGGGTKDSIFLTKITSSASNNLIYFQMVRRA